jgi:hypothetical protein
MGPRLGDGQECADAATEISNQNQADKLASLNCSTIEITVFLDSQALSSDTRSYQEIPGRSASMHSDHPCARPE